MASVPVVMEDSCLHLKLIEIYPPLYQICIQLQNFIPSKCIHYFIFLLFRALQLLTKRNFQPPGLQHKNKWSNNFHDFVASALKKDPPRRPAARDLLKVSI